MSEPLIEVKESAEALATAVAGEFLSRIADLQSAGHVPTVGLTGGSIAGAVHRELARLGPGSGVDWQAIDFYFGDERFVPADSPERNVGQARAAFLAPLGVPDSRIHSAPAQGEAADVDAAAAAYSADIRAHGRGGFDLLMFGVGPDGHVASLFPGSAQLTATDAIAVGVADSPKPPPERVTLTYEALNRATSVWFLVSGEGKADAVARAHSGADADDIPAVGVAGSEETVWFLDREAASRL